MASPRPPSYVRRDKTPALGAPTTNDRKLDLFLQNIHERIESINNQDLEGQLSNLRAQILTAEGTTTTVADATGAVTYRGSWDAASGTAPSAGPAKGDYYVVSAEGTTTLSGISDWGVDDWAVFNGVEWEAVRNFTLAAGDNITLTRNGSVITVTGQETSRPGDAQSPEYIRADESYTVVEDRQVLYMLPITVDGTLTLDGSLVEVETVARSNDLRIRTVAANTNLTPADWTVLVDASGGPVDITPPTASSANQQAFNIKKIDSSGNVVTIIATVDGDTNPDLASQYDSISIQSDGERYWLL